MDLVPNLDAVPADELMRFWNNYQSGRNATSMFPAKPKGYKSATGDLANYASNKATAMQCRIRGEIDTALMYESICDRIYAKLPEYAKW
jgi:hypothetical protein